MYEDTTIIDGRKVIFTGQGTKILMEIFDSNTIAVPVVQEPEITPIQVKYNGNLLSLDTAPIMRNNRLLVPIRPIAEAMGATLEWDQRTQTAVLTLGIKEVRITIDEKTAYVDDAPVTLDVPAQVSNGRTLVPLRFISQGLGAKIDWDETPRTAYVNYTPST